MEGNKSLGISAMSCTQSMEYEHQCLKRNVKKDYLANQYNGTVKYINSLSGMINQAIPATIKFPKVQKAAMKLSIDPRFDLG